MADHRQDRSQQRSLSSLATRLGQASWLFPLKGIYYFLGHPFLWPLFRARLLPSVLLSLFILTNLFIWTYLPQVAFLAIFHGRQLAFLNGAFLVLGEGAAIVALLFETFLVDETLVDVFDAVLIKTGNRRLVAVARVLHDAGDDPVKQLGKPTESAVYSPFSLRQIVEFIFLLPLNLIPVAGTPIFLFMTGYRAGPFHHWRYFQLRGLSKPERRDFVQRRKLRYTWFGTVALLLQLIPVLSMFFLLSTAAGSALWVAQLEKARAALGAGSDDQNARASYTDDPA